MNKPKGKAKRKSNRQAALKFILMLIAVILFAIVLLSLMGPAVGNVFSEIQVEFELTVTP